jgi:hypothetical protein
MNKNLDNLEKLQASLDALQNNQSTIYFLTYDTKNSPRASVKYIYDLALTLKNNGYNAKLLVEDKTYGGVSSWMGEIYDSIEVLTIKEDKVQIKLEDVLVVPELYSNALSQLANIKCVKVMLVQQKEYIFESLPIGSRWFDYGFDMAITTTQAAKNYINEFFPQTTVYVIPPMIGDKFEPSDKPLKPYIAISCRERTVSRKIISEFYLKYPQLRWVTFKDMIQLSYDEFSEALKECMVSVWVDDESTFGTFPLECMKCGVPVVGKIPSTEPDWLSENGMWTYDSNKLVEILGTYVMAWFEGVELTQQVKDKMKETLIPYSSTITEKNIVTIFQSIKNNRLNKIQLAIDKFKLQEEEK